MRLALLLLLSCLLAGPAYANNIEITNIIVADEVVPSNSEYLLELRFDLSWENSWRITSGPTNFDGAYVFAKYRANGGEWKFLGNGNAGTAPGFNNEGFARDGKMLYRSATNTGSGNAVLTDVLYGGTIEDPDFDPNAEIEVRMFAIEMVWIPTADYQLGESTGPTNGFYAPNGGAYDVTNENSITVGPAGDLRVSQDNGNAGTYPATIPSGFPKGYSGYWMMKYEVSQQQYVDFFNTLTELQKSAFDVTGPRGKNTDAVVDRNGCTWPGSGEMTTTLPNVAMNYVIPELALAYLDWSGLRPMTEFEFVKAARGTRTAVIGEYAWGTDRVAGSSYQRANIGTPSEGYTQMSTTAGNAQYQETDDVGGPLRVGGIAASAVTASREQSGAGYYGVMDLSGNLAELAVSTGTDPGRSFRDIRGDFVIDISFAGFNLPTSWPAGDDANNFSFLGGAYGGTEELLRIADRTLGSGLLGPAFNNLGFRGVVRQGFDQVD